MKKNILLTFLTILVLLNSTAIGYFIYHDQKEHQENEEPPFFLMKSSAVDFPTALSLAGEQVTLERIDVAEAFKKANEAGRSAYLSGLGRTIERGASASSPLTGFLEN